MPTETSTRGTLELYNIMNETELELTSVFYQNNLEKLSEARNYFFPVVNKERKKWIDHNLNYTWIMVIWERKEELAKKRSRGPH